jgi:hypothetical protein
MLPNVLAWIRACSQDMIERKAAALVLAGPPGIGKTKIFEALARMWGADSFVPLADSVAQFNSTIARCPIVLDDECAALKARDVTSAEFRQRVQARIRDFEPKGKEKVSLRGCTREGVTANELSEVVFRDVRGPGVLDALRDRLLVVERTREDAPAIRAALAAIRAGGDDEHELARIVGHLAALWAEPAPTSEERFIGAGGVGAERVALAGVDADGTELWELLGTFLAGDWPTDERAHPWVVRDGALMAYPSAVARSLEIRGRGWDMARVQRVLGAVRLGEATRLRTEIGRVRYWPLDWDRVILLTGADAEAILARL